MYGVEEYLEGVKEKKTITVLSELLEEI